MVTIAVIVSTSINSGEEMNALNKDFTKVLLQSAILTIESSIFTIIGHIAQMHMGY